MRFQINLHQAGQCRKIGNTNNLVLESTKTKGHKGESQNRQRAPMLDRGNLVFNRNGIKMTIRYALLKLRYILYFKIKLFDALIYTTFLLRFSIYDIMGQYLRQEGNNIKHLIIKCNKVPSVLVSRLINQPPNVTLQL